MIIGFIDIGSNSIKLLLAEVDESGNFKALKEDREVVRLGHNVYETSLLNEKNMELGLKAMQGFVKLCKNMQADKIVAFATSALREAKNRNDFITRVEKDTGVRIEVISGLEEARLIHLAFSKTYHIEEKNTLIIDVGGGSTEFILGNNKQIHFCTSLNLGALRLKETHKKDADKFVNKELELIHRHIEGVLEESLMPLAGFDIDSIVATGGTATTLASIHQKMTGNLSPIEPFTLDVKELEKIIETLASMSCEKRIEAYGVEENRADIIVPGALILLDVLKILRRKKLLVVKIGLKNGILYDNISKVVLDDSFLSRVSVQKNTIKKMMERYYSTMVHAGQVERLSLQLFDQLQALHKMGVYERHLLSCASYLHDIGHFIDHSKHHKHSYYLISNSPLMGFSFSEKEFIANVARYHSKGSPNDKHENYRNLSLEEKEKVKKLSAILRIADALDRSHHGPVRKIKVSIRNEKVILSLDVEGDIQLELWALPKKAQFFSEVFKLEVEAKVI